MKSTFIALLLSLCLMQTFGDVVLYYAMEKEPNANVVADTSPIGTRAGTIQGSVVFETGYIGNASLFNKDKVTNDGVIIAGPGDFGETFTVAFWAKLIDDTLDANMKAASKKKAFADLVGWEIQYNPKQKQLTIIGSGEDTVVVDNDFALDWHFIAVVFNKDTVIVTVDGVDVTPAADNKISAIVNNPDRDLLIGSSSAITVPAGGAWIGYIDEFRVYNEALTVEKINAAFTEDKATAAAQVPEPTSTSTTGVVDPPNPNPSTTGTNSGTVVVVSAANSMDWSMITMAGLIAFFVGRIVRF